MICKLHRHSMKNEITKFTAFYKDRETREENDPVDKFV